MSDGVVACDACLRRAWLVARLAGRLEIARLRRGSASAGRLREILALPDERLVTVLAGTDAAVIASELEAVEPEELRASCLAAHVTPVCRHDERYPKRLHDLPDPPAVLFVAGEPGRLVELVGGALDDGSAAVAVVGTRRASPDGLEVARGLGRGVGAAGVTVVSGMALGVDSAAHAGALGAEGATVAVLAGGADRPYPASKRALYRSIVERHCVVSEMPPGFTPMRWCFPARNRIIAGLAHSTVVVEAAERSGSLITAEYAADLGREVAAVPGPVSSWRSAGTNALLRDGATLIRHARDVLDAVVGVEGAATAAPADPAATLEPRLASVLRAVEGGRDTVGALAGTPDQAQSTLAALSELELMGLLRRVPGGRYVPAGR
jgi:DNA processing protein